MTTPEQMARRIVVINRNVSSISNSAAISGIHNGEWFITQDTQILYWKDAVTGQIKQIAKAEDGAGPVIKNVVSSLTNTLEIEQIKDGEIFLLASTGDIYYKKDSKITQVTGNTSVSNSVANIDDFTGINKLPNGTFFTTLDTGNVYFKNTKDGSINQVTETNNPNSPILSSIVTSITDATAISKLKNGELFIIADSGEIYYKYNNKIIQVTGYDSVANSVSTITNTIEVEKIKKNNFFIARDTGRAYFKSEKDGIITQITNNSFYGDLTAQNPNTFVDTDGTMKRSTVVFGDVITKNIGDTVGKLPFAENVFKAAYNNDSTIQQYSIENLDCNTILPGERVFVYNTATLKNKPPLEGNYFFIECKRAATSADPSWNIQIAVAYPSGQTATRYSGNGTYRAWAASSSNIKTFNETVDTLPNVTVDSTGKLNRILTPLGNAAVRTIGTAPSQVPLASQVPSLLGTAATRNVGDSIGDVMTVGFQKIGQKGFGGEQINITDFANLKAALVADDIAHLSKYWLGNVGHLGYPGAIFFRMTDTSGFSLTYAHYNFNNSTKFPRMLLHQGIGTENPTTTQGDMLLLGINVSKDANNFLKDIDDSTTVYTETTPNLPNVVVSENGKLSRTTNTLGNVAVRNIGTIAGQVPLVENIKTLAEIPRIDAYLNNATNAASRQVGTAAGQVPLSSQVPSLLGSVALKNVGTAADQVPLSSQVPSLLGTVATKNVGTASTQVPLSSDVRGLAWTPIRNFASYTTNIIDNDQPGFYTNHETNSGYAENRWTSQYYTTLVLGLNSTDVKEDGLKQIHWQHNSNNIYQRNIKGGVATSWIPISTHISHYEKTTDDYPNTTVNTQGEITRSTKVLGTASTRNVGTAADQVPLSSQVPSLLGTAATRDIEAFMPRYQNGIGKGTFTAQYATSNVSAYWTDIHTIPHMTQVALVDYGTWGYPQGIHFKTGNDQGFDLLTSTYALNSARGNVRIVIYNGAERRTGFLLASGLNAFADSNGFWKTSSPVVRVFANTFEPNDDAEKQGITYTRNGIGDYTLHNTLGLAQTGWRIELPHDENRNPLIAIETNELPNGDINIKTYKRIFSMETFMFAPDKTQPLDIPEGRCIDVRLHEIIEDSETEEDTPVNDK